MIGAEFVPAAAVVVLANNRAVILVDMVPAETVEMVIVGSVAGVVVAGILRDADLEFVDSGISGGVVISLARYEVGLEKLGQFFADLSI